MKKILAIVVLATLPGCLTPEQQAEVEALRADIQNAADTIAELEPVYRQLDDALADLVKAFKEKRVPLEEFQRLSSIIREEKKTVLDHIDQLREQIRDGRERLDNLEAQGVPWYKVALSLLGNVVLAGLFGERALKKRKVSATMDAMIVGIESALKNVPQSSAEPILTEIERSAYRNNVAAELHERVKELTGTSGRAQG